jgi:hypothetical protein
VYAQGRVSWLLSAAVVHLLKTACLLNENGCANIGMDGPCFGEQWLDGTLRAPIVVDDSAIGWPMPGIDVASGQVCSDD